MVSKPVTLQIQHDQCPARNSTQLFDQFDDFMISKMMQNGRAKHEIERVRQEREVKSIRRDPRPRRPTQMESAVVQRDHRCILKAAPNAVSHVA